MKENARQGFWNPLARRSAIASSTPAARAEDQDCGVETDQALVTFAADVDWAKQNGAKVERFNLAQQPLVFADNATVKGFLERGTGSAADDPR